MITPRRIDGANVRFGYFTTADGMLIRYGRWSYESKNPRGSVVLLGGRKEFLEKYAETAADLNQRGFAVFGFDWRGRGLSIRMLPDRLKGFVRHHDDYGQDLHDFLQESSSRRPRDRLMCWRIRREPDGPSMRPAPRLVTHKLSYPVSPAARYFKPGNITM